MADTIKIKTFAEFQKYNFFRSPEWRWERVLALVDRSDGIPGRTTKRDDDVVRKARNFVLRWRNGDKDMRQRLLWENAGLYYAYEYQQRLADDPEAAMYIQARLLAKQTPEYIGSVMGIMPEAIQWYSELFFDVIPYLHHRDWITKQILIPAIIRSPLKGEDTPAVGFQDSTVARPFMDGSLKMFAYFGGTYLVDLLIAGIQSGKPLSSPDDTGTWLDNNISTTIRRRTAQAAQLFQINKYNVMELFAVHTRIMEIEKSVESQDSNKSTQERHIKAMMDEIPWSVGSDGEKVYEGSMIGRFDKMAGELRDDELLLVASGQIAKSVGVDYPLALPAPRKVKKAVLTSDETVLP